MMHSFPLSCFVFGNISATGQNTFKNFSAKIDILDFILNKSSGVAADTDPGGEGGLTYISRPVHLSDLHYFICYFPCYLTIIP